MNKITSVLKHNLYKRLKNDYNTHKSLIIAFDFDNTIRPFGSEFEKMDCSPVINLLQRCSNLGFTLILFTVTVHGTIESKEKYIFCRDQGLTKGKFYTNECALFNESPKPYYNCLLDDRAGLFETYSALNRLVSEIEFKNKTINQIIKEPGNKETKISKLHKIIEKIRKS